MYFSLSLLQKRKPILSGEEKYNESIMLIKTSTVSLILVINENEVFQNIKEREYCIYLIHV